MYCVGSWGFYHCRWAVTIGLLNRKHENIPLHWRHNDHDGVSNHQPHHCLLNRLFRRRSRKTPKLRVTGLCVGNSPGPVNSPHKGPVTRKMFPFDDVIMLSSFSILRYRRWSESYLTEKTWSDWNKISVFWLSLKFILRTKYDALASGWWRAIVWTSDDNLIWCVFASFWLSFQKA